MGEPPLVAFREARRADIAAVVALLRDDSLGHLREDAALSDYLAAFDAMAPDPDNFLIVGEYGGGPVATYQITVITGLSLRATRRAQIEGVRVALPWRGRGIGRQVFEDAERRARAAGCSLMQLTTNAARIPAQAFYARIGFTASHIGYKRDL